MHSFPGEIHDDTFPYPARRQRRFVPGSLEHAVERFALKIDRYETDNAGGGRQLRDSCAFVFLCGWTVDLKDFYAGKLGHAPGATVISGAENHQLRRAGSDR